MTVPWTDGDLTRARVVHSDVHACKFALAFQIADDILGLIGNPDVGSLILGIPIETRATLVDSLWLEGAKAHAYALAAEAAATLAVFGG
jgi:hypothetical protein